MSLSKNTIVSLVVACAILMEQMDGAIIATALPRIAQSLDANPLHLSLAITSYMFSLAVFIPISGWMADRFGSLTVFKTAIIVFTIGSIACGLSFSLWQLIASRLLQGAGGAMMVPVGRLVLLRAIPKEKLVEALSWMTAPAMMGPILGPPLGGFIATYTSWRWIFLVNVPIGIAGYFLANRYMDNIKEDFIPPPDIPGFALISTSMIGIVFFAETAGRGVISTSISLLALAMATIGLLAYAVRSKGIQAPAVDLSVFKFATYRASVMGGSIFRIAAGALPFLLPMLLQYGFGRSPAVSGMVTFGGAAGAGLMKLLATPIIRRTGFKPLLIINAAFNCLFIAGCASFTENSALTLVFTFLFMGGFFRSLQFTALNTLAFEEIPEHLMSKANTLYSMLQQLSLSLGVTLGSLALHETMQWKSRDVLQATDFWPAFLCVTVIAQLSVFAYLKLPQDAGASLYEKKPR